MTKIKILVLINCLLITIFTISSCVNPAELFKDDSPDNDKIQNSENTQDSPENHENNNPPPNNQEEQPDYENNGSTEKTDKEAVQDTNNELPDSTHNPDTESAPDNDKSSTYCGDGILSNSEVCELNESRDCSSFLGNNYSGKVFCLTDCSAWDFRYCDKIFVHDSDNQISDLDNSVVDSEQISDNSNGDDSDTPFLYCGDGIISNSEICDSQSISCEALNSEYQTGAAKCLANCSGWDTGSCIKPFCGNGEQEKGEACDLGIENGDLFCEYGSTCEKCNKECEITYIQGAYCGDKIKNGSEICDNSSISCSLLKGNYYSGNAQCNNNCNGYQESTCAYHSICGDGIVELEEKCDSNSLTCQNYYENYFLNLKGMISCDNCTNFNITNCSCDYLKQEVCLNSGLRGANLNVLEPSSYNKIVLWWNVIYDDRFAAGDVSIKIQNQKLSVENSDFYSVPMDVYNGSSNLVVCKKDVSNCFYNEGSCSNEDKKNLGEYAVVNGSTTDIIFPENLKNKIFHFWTFKNNVSNIDVWNISSIVSASKPVFIMFAADAYLNDVRINELGRTDWILIKDEKELVIGNETFIPDNVCPIPMKDTIVLDASGAIDFSVKSPKDIFCTAWGEEERSQNIKLKANKEYFFQKTGAISCENLKVGDDFYCTGAAVNQAKACELPGGGFGCANDGKCK